MSNLVNAGFRRICVLTQYKSLSLDRHLAQAWRLSSMLDEYVIAVPAQQWRGPYWQAGSADAIYQSMNLIDNDQPDLVVVAGADHVYRMDPAQMIGQHIAWGAGVTVAALPVPRTRNRLLVASALQRPPHRGVLGKARRSAGWPGHPGQALASIGLYVFTTSVLMEALIKDAADEGSRHSIGADIIPQLVRERAAHVYDFRQNEVPGAGPRRPRLLAGRRDNRFLLLRAPGPVRDRAHVQPLQQPLAHPDPRACAAACQVRA